ncbi:MAG: prolyl oligopeptidase family serine peptidase [Pyrinomonadaceae bacterium]
MDGSCNPDRSKSFHDACYGDMADNTLPDQIDGIKQLAKDYTFIDLEVNVWGHSGGGFATAATCFRYPDFYKVGISESGNHDNRNYGLTGANGISVSSKAIIIKNRANQIYAKDLKGKLLLAHGGLDDNVPPQYVSGCRRFG